MSRSRGSQRTSKGAARSRRATAHRGGSTSRGPEGQGHAAGGGHAWGGKRTAARGLGLAGNGWARSGLSLASSEAERAARFAEPGILVVDLYPKTTEKCFWQPPEFWDFSRTSSAWGGTCTRAWAARSGPAARSPCRRRRRLHGLAWTGRKTAASGSTAGMPRVRSRRAVNRLIDLANLNVNFYEIFMFLSNVNNTKQYYHVICFRRFLKNTTLYSESDAGRIETFVGRSLLAPRHCCNRDQSWEARTACIACAPRIALLFSRTCTARRLSKLG